MLRARILTLVLVGGLSPAVAQRVDLGGVSVTITPIAVVEGADQMAALAKAAEVLQAYMADHQVEACGELLSNADNAFRIHLATSAPLDLPGQRRGCGHG